MGLTLKFLAGDAETLTEVFKDDAYYKFDDPQVIKAEADFSLHIEPRDLNALSVFAGEFSGRPPMDLRSQLALGVDAKDHGLLRVSHDWVAYIAAVPLAAARGLAECWAARMREHYRSPAIVVTDAMICAISDLIKLCQRASPEAISVVHVWWL